MDQKMDQKKTGQFIAALRKEKGLTQQQLADKLYIGREAVSKWERGVGYPGITYLLDISEEFGVSVNEILYGERITEENKAEVEKAALTLYDKTRKRLTKLRKILVASIIFLVGFYFVSYFIYNYNSIQVYITSSTGENFTIDQGMILAAKNKLYFKLGNINNHTDEEIEIINLYYQNGKDKIEIISVNKIKDVVVDLNEYQSISKVKSTSEIVNNLVIEIKTKTISESHKIDAILDYKNDFLFGVESYDNETENLENAMKTFSENKTTVNVDNIKKKFKLVDGEYVYNFKYKKKKYRCSLMANNIYATIKNVDLKYNLISNSIYINENDKITIYYIENQKCDEGDCDKYSDLIETFIKDVLN